MYIDIISYHQSYLKFETYLLYYNQSKAACALLFYYHYISYVKIKARSLISYESIFLQIVVAVAVSLRNTERYTDNYGRYH